MLIPWAAKKAIAGLPPPIFARSANLVSSPMLVKARANHHVLNPPNIPFVASTVLESRRKEKTTEAIMKPRTNLGNLNQISMAPGFSPGTAFLNVHTIASIKAAKPMRTF